MPDNHTHEWTVSSTGGGAVCYVFGCFESITMAEIERRLSATEMLGGAQANSAAGVVDAEFGFTWKWENEGRNPPLRQVYEALMAYVAALDG